MISDVPTFFISIGHEVPIIWNTGPPLYGNTVSHIYKLALGLSQFRRKVLSASLIIIDKLINLKYLENLVSILSLWAFDVVVKYSTLQFLSLRVCLNPASWLPLATRASFTQPLREKYALPSTVAPACKVSVLCKVN